MRFVLIAAFLGISSVAEASPQCTAEPETKWLSEAAIRDKVVAAGNVIDVFKKTKGSCYEVYGRDPSGKRIEIYYNPVNGDIVDAH